MPNVFSNISGLRPGRSVFNLSHSKLLSGYFGQLYPVLCEEMVPGDTFKMGAQVVMRFQPLVSPVLHEIDLTVHYYFVPYRILWSSWESFITGGPTGNDAPTFPVWNPTSYAVGSLWDYLGFPAGVKPSSGYYPSKMPMYAYNKIYNEYYRDQTQIAEISLDNELLRKRAWRKDYFTAALPWMQRGTAPSLPISGQLSLSWPAGAFVTPPTGTTTYPVFNSNTPGTAIAYGSSADHIANIKAWLEQGTANAAGATTFNVSDLRLAFQIQKFLERNARSGARYTEFLRAHFGVSPRDDRLQRPEYLGGARMPVIVSEVLQTSKSEAGAPQGNLAGHGISVGQQFIASYTAQEFGIVMAILSVCPVPMYSQGIERQWLRRSRYDFYFPEFAHLSEQPIKTVELWVDGNATNEGTVFGYVGRYDEMRVKRNMVVHKFRPASQGGNLNFWHLGREFGSMPALNQAFLEVDNSAMSRIFAVTSEPGLLIHFGNQITAIRPLPVEGSPGLMDHA